MSSEGGSEQGDAGEGDGVEVVGRVKVRRQRRRVAFSEENIIDEVDEEQGEEGEEENIITDNLEDEDWESFKGGYDYEFVDGTDQKYECPICLHCLRDPVLTTCGHRFCSGCILQWVTKEDGKCPVDSVSISPENIFPDNYTRREILACLAKCPYISPKDNTRCTIVLPVSDLEKHIENEHTSHYDYLMGLNGILEPHPSGGGGPSSSIPSPGTSSALPNGLIECPYKPFGCTVTLREDQRDKHIEQQVHKHLGLLQCAYSRLKIYQNTASSSSRSNLPEYLRQDSRDSTRWLLQDESSDDYQFRRQRSWDSVRFARKHLRPASHLVTSGSSAWMPVSEESLCYPQAPQHTPSLPLPPHPQYTSTPRQHHNHHHPHQQSHPSSHHPQKERDTCGGASDGASCSPEKGKLNGGGGGGDGGDPHLADIFKRLVLLEQQNYEKQIKIEKLQAELNSVLSLSRTSAQIIEDFQARHCNGLYVWKVSNFRRRCLDMRRNPNRWLYSPGFYTDTFGYKIFLRFNLTAPALTTSAGASTSSSSSTIQAPGHHGQDPGQVPLEEDHDTFVSLYVHFMPGEFDDTLPWPFKGSMTLMIVHPSKPEESVVEYMQSKAETTAFDKPPPPHNTKGFGYAEFWPLHKIFSDGFVKDDTLTFEIIAKSVDRQHALK